MTVWTSTDTGTSVNEKSRATLVLAAAWLMSSNSISTSCRENGKMSTSTPRNGIGDKPPTITVPLMLKCLVADVHIAGPFPSHPGIVFPNPKISRRQERVVTWIKEAHGWVQTR